MKNTSTAAPAVNTGPVRRSGGLYARVKMSVKSANIMVSVLCILLIAVTVFLIKNAGFTVQFNTNGGSGIPSIKAMHSEVLNLAQTPVREGYRFTGWYTDEACTNRWPENSPIETSMTLYAGWEKVQL